MHYVRREQLEDNLVGDADSLMREMYRAAQALVRIDQNNIANEVLLPDNVTSSSSSDLGITVSRASGGGLLFVAPAGLAPIPWDDVTRWWTSTSALEFTLEAEAHMRFYADGYLEHDSTVAPIGLWDVRLSIDGEGSPEWWVGSGSSGTVADTAWSVTATAVLSAGSHSVRVQVRDRSIRTTSSGAATFQATRLHAIGFRR